jgi:hypothetical protein
MGSRKEELKHSMASRTHHRRPLPPAVATEEDDKQIRQRDGWR